MGLRPVARWFGGKAQLAPLIVPLLPPHSIYVEPYGGMASVLMRKAPSHFEVYNDLNGDAVTVFRVLRDPVKAARLKRLCALTPYSRVEYVDAFDEGECDDVERARRIIFRSFAGYGSRSSQRTITGMRTSAREKHRTCVDDWAGWPAHVPLFTGRLRRVFIESRPAVEVIGRYDAMETLFYIDPPYLPQTRRYGKAYIHEMGAEDHEELIDLVLRLKGMVVLSGRPAPLYKRLTERGWQQMTPKPRPSGGWRTEEAIWLSPSAIERGKHVADQPKQLRLT